MAVIGHGAPPALDRALGIGGRIRRWRGLRRVAPAWTIAVALIVAVILLPLGTILTLAFGAEPGTWPHLMRTILPAAVLETALLLLGVGTLTLAVGTTTAWVVTMYRFPGRDLVDRLLVIPLAMPTYIVAYCYVDLLDYAGIVQTALRELFAWRTPRDYWFPDIRSLGGAVIVLSLVLYPYVYLAARASFVQQSVCVLEVARTLGRTSWGAFREVALPMARPALAAGVALALMECLNDLGAVQYLGVQTLTVSIYATWLQRSSLGGAAQIAAVMLVVVLALVLLERLARGRGRVHHTTGRYRAIPFSDLEGPKAWGVAALCLLPFVLGFVVPVLVLLRNAVKAGAAAVTTDYLSSVWHSIVLATLAACAAVIVGLVLAYARRVAPNGFTRPAVRLSGLGYAVPGTVLALGLLIPLAAFDNGLDRLLRASFGISTGLLLTGSIFALVLAYTIRFLAVSLGTIEAGLERVSPNLDAASRTLGRSVLQTLGAVHLPLLVAPLGAAALLVFVDAMKELPATLLLRPFDFDTLAVKVYSYAALERFEEAALGALTIVAAGLLPVLLLHRAVSTGRAGSGGGS